MPAILKAGEIRPDELPELIAKLAPAEAGLTIWAEGIDGWSLDRWNGLEKSIRWNRAGRASQSATGREALRRSPAGRLFAPGGELKWRLRDANRCRLVFLGERDWLPGQLRDRDDLARLGLSRRFEEAILWGQRTEGSEPDWVELRIPHRLRYPVAETGRTPASRTGVKVETEVWSDPWGEPHFVRLRELVAYPLPRA